MLLVWSVILKTGSLLTPSSKWLVCYQILDIPKWRHMMLSYNSQQKVCCQLLLETHIYKMFTRGGGREQLSNSRGFQQIWFEQHQKRHSKKESVFLQKKLRSYAGHDPPLFRTSGKVQTKSFRTFVLKGYLQSPLSTVQTSINLLLKIKRNRYWKWISN